MSYRNSNYTAFYVDESQPKNNLDTCFAKDFCYYQLLKLWKIKDGDFPFIDAHGKTYNVRDGSDWKSTLKPRLHERLRISKNIILILSSATKQSKALCEEITYGIDVCGLPVIVVYPGFNFVGYENLLSSKVIDLWNNLPCFRSRINEIPTAHVPFKKGHIEAALKDPRLSAYDKRENCIVGLNTSDEYREHQASEQFIELLGGRS